MQTLNQKFTDITFANLIQKKLGIQVSDIIIFDNEIQCNSGTCRCGSVVKLYMYQPEHITRVCHSCNHIVYESGNYSTIVPPLIDLTSLFTILNCSEDNLVLVKHKRDVFLKKINDIKNGKDSEHLAIVQQLNFSCRETYEKNLLDAYYLLLLYDDDHYFRKPWFGLLRGFITEFPMEFQYVSRFKMLKNYIVLKCKKENWTLYIKNSKYHVKTKVQNVGIKDFSILIDNAHVSKIKNPAYFRRAMLC